VYATTREDPARAVNSFFHYVDRAVLTNVEVDWAGLQVSDVMPHRMPDLFASRPTILHGRYRGRPAGTVTVHAKAAERAVSIPVDARRSELAGGPDDVLGTLWARSKITDLEEQLWEGSDAGVQDQITRLGIGFNLVTRFTSFVAVDNTRTIGDGRPQRVVQPVEEPEGVDVDMAGGRRSHDGWQGAQPAKPPSTAGNLAPNEDTDGAADCPPDAPGCGSDEGAESEAPMPARQYAAPASAPPADAGDFEVASKRGCGCRLSGTETDGAWVALAALICLRLRRRKRVGLRSAA
jgi:Ca-activated chloride channel family protein